MKTSIRYDRTVDPPAPVVPIRVSTPSGQGGVLVHALLDSGADCTLVPEAVVRALGLPVVDRIWIEGVGGSARRAPVFAARVEFAHVARIARVVAVGSEAILGRDLLNAAVALLDGPALAVTFRPPSKRS